MICRLEDENAKPIASVHDRFDHLVRLQPPLSDMASPCLRFIDPYGDAVFNKFQMAPLLEELEEVRKRAPQQAQEVLEQVTALARRCRDEVHLYLRFLGD